MLGRACADRKSSFAQLNGFDDSPDRRLEPWTDSPHFLEAALAYEDMILDKGGPDRVQELGGSNEQERTDIFW